MEKKGLFGRMLDFFREKIGMGETGGVGFWNDRENTENHFAEMGTVVFLSQNEMKKTFWEEKIEAATEEKEKNDEISAKKKVPFLEIERKEELQIIPEEKKKGELFTSEVFQRERAAETKNVGLERTFLRDISAEDREKRNIIPITVEPEQKTEKVIEEAQEMPERKTVKQKEIQAEKVVDIEKLMQQMTKKLWEERESCGRRLR